jgi:hypothetical protein
LRGHIRHHIGTVHLRQIFLPIQTHHPYRHNRLQDHDRSHHLEGTCFPGFGISCFFDCSLLGLGPTHSDNIDNDSLFHCCRVTHHCSQYFVRTQILSLCVTIRIVKIDCGRQSIYSDFRMSLHLAFSKTGAVTLNVDKIKGPRILATVKKYGHRN